MPTPQLEISHITANQNNKETTANAAFDALDNAMNALLDVAAAATITLTEAQFRACQMIRVTGALGAAFLLDFPSGTAKQFMVFNNTNRTMRIECGSSVSTQAELEAGYLGVFYCEGDEIYKVAEAAAVTPTPSSFDIGVFVAGVPLGEELVMRYVFVSDVELPAGLTGSQARAGTASTGTLRFTLEKNGTYIGYIQFASSSTGTFSLASATSFTAGDILAIYADEYGEDNTLADVSLTLKGTRL